MDKWQAWIVSSIVVATVNVENSEQHRETEKLPQNFFNYIHVHVCTVQLMLDAGDAQYSSVCVFFLVTSTFHKSKFDASDAYAIRQRHAHTQQQFSSWSRYVSQKILFPPTVMACDVCGNIKSN